MTSLRGRTVRVAGAGALGLSIAVELADAGAAVTVFDPSPETSASRVAAGMLAPVFEAALDPGARHHFSLLMAARDCWPVFAERVGVKLDRSGAAYAGVQALQARRTLAEFGVASELTPDGLFTAEDWRLDAGSALAALRAGAEARGVIFVRERLDQTAEGDAVAATGWQKVSWAPESAVITAIKGQLTRLNGEPPFEGPVMRRDGGYIAPGAEGVIYGATMQPGLTDLAADDAVVELMERLYPDFMTAGVLGQVQVGIRGATPDGLPLVGPSAAPGVWLAMGARRNGWLLAPLVAAMTRAYLAGDDPGPWAEMLNARRFTAPTLEGQ